ncbi:MAG TPA: hypothetical protein VIX84_07710 [Acidimicrobiales bacterium]
MHPITLGPLADDPEEMQSFLALVVDSLGPYDSALAGHYAVEVGRCLWQQQRFGKWSALGFSNISAKSADGEADWWLRLAADFRRAADVVRALDEQSISRGELEITLGMLNQLNPKDDGEWLSGTSREDLKQRVRQHLTAFPSPEAAAERLSEAATQLEADASDRNCLDAPGAAEAVITSDFIRNLARAEAHADRRLSRALERLDDQKERDAQRRELRSDREGVVPLAEEPT